MSGLKGFPKTLNLEQQGMFALGYYHQRASDQTRMREASDRRRKRPGAGRRQRFPKPKTETTSNWNTAKPTGLGQKQEECHQ